MVQTEDDNLAEAFGSIQSYNDGVEGTTAQRSADESRKKKLDHLSTLAIAAKTCIQRVLDGIGSAKRADLSDLLNLIIQLGRVR